MERIRNWHSRIITLMFACAGAIAADSRAQSPPQRIVIDERHNGDLPIVRFVRGAPTSPFDGEFESAIKLFRLGRFAEAEREFARDAEVRKATRWGDRSQFYLAECQFHQRNYLAAFVSFKRLHAEYPATDYRDQAVTREYQMGRIWLARARHEVPAVEKPPAAAPAGAKPPVADFRQLALRAFEAVRNTDPTGPLAADAAIQIAEHYMRIHDYDSAAIYYAQFVSEYARSPLARHARLGAIQARIGGFLVSQWDTPGVRMARELLVPLLGLR